MIDDLVHRYLRENFGKDISTASKEEIEIACRETGKMIAACILSDYIKENNESIY
jgi:hypothetical protein